MSTSLPVEKNQIFTVHILNSHIITEYHDEGKPEYHSLLALHCFFSAFCSYKSVNDLFTV